MADTDNVLYAFLALILGGMILFAVYKTSSNSSKEKFEKQMKIRENMSDNELRKAKQQIKALEDAKSKSQKQLQGKIDKLQGQVDAAGEQFKNKQIELFNTKKAASNDRNNFKRQANNMKETFKSTLAKCPGGNFENFSNKTTTIGKMKKEAFKKGKIPLRENYAGDNLGINTGANQLTSAELASNVARGGAVQITSARQLGMELPSNATVGVGPEPFRRRAGGRRMRR